MFDLYLISILDGIVGCALLFFLIGLAATLTTIICSCTNSKLDDEYRYDRHCIRMNKSAIKICKPFIYIGIVALLLLVFVPTTKQGYIIYGVGGTIDYLKNNDVAKQLPDKTILALDKFLEKEINDNDDNKKE